MHVFSLYISLALPGALPSQGGPIDTTQVFRGYAGQQYAWGRVVLTNGKELRAYLPATGTGLDLVLAYYTSPPTSGVAPKPKYLAVGKVRYMRVRGHYSELLKMDKQDSGRLGVRRVAGPVEVFVARSRPRITISTLGATPVFSTPATADQATETNLNWYLRRPGGTILPIDPDKFASQVSAFFADDNELARRIAAGQAGYGLAELEELVQQYNQRVSRR